MDCFSPGFPLHLLQEKVDREYYECEKEKTSIYVCITNN